jgi:hypothetical protein
MFSSIRRSVVRQWVFFKVCFIDVQPYDIYTEENVYSYAAEKFASLTETVAKDTKQKIASYMEEKVAGCT